MEGKGIGRSSSVAAVDKTIKKAPGVKAKGGGASGGGSLSGSRVTLIKVAPFRQ
jgi:hypothetical protein